MCVYANLIRKCRTGATFEGMNEFWSDANEVRVSYAFIIDIPDIYARAGFSASPSFG